MTKRLIKKSGSTGLNEKSKLSPMMSAVLTEDWKLLKKLQDEDVKRGFLIDPYPEDVHGC